MSLYDTVAKFHYTMTEDGRGAVWMTHGEDCRKCAVLHRNTPDADGKAIERPSVELVGADKRSLTQFGTARLWADFWQCAASLLDKAQLLDSAKAPYSAGTKDPVPFPAESDSS